jgi:hypothetical protein
MNVFLVVGIGLTIFGLFQEFSKIDVPQPAETPEAKAAREKFIKDTQAADAKAKEVKEIQDKIAVVKNIAEKADELKVLEAKLAELKG